jgi:hypothetical protein
MVYTSMTTQALVDGRVEFAQETMARDLNRSRAWVNGGAKELERMGLIRVERVFVDGLQRPSRYLLIDGLRKSPGPDGSADPEELVADPVGETTCTTHEKRSGEDESGDGHRCQHAVSVADQPADGVPQSTDHLRCQRADTSHDSQIHISPSDGRERADRSLDKGSAAKPVDAPAIDPDWRPVEEDLAWARARVPDLDTEAFTQSFVLTCLAKDYRYADPSFGWRLWIADPKKPLPTLAFKPQLKPQAPASGDCSHDRIDIEFQSSRDLPGGQRKIFRDHAESQRKTFSSDRAGQGAGNLRALNAGRAAACLGRLLARRGVHPSA